MKTMYLYDSLTPLQESIAALAIGSGWSVEGEKLTECVKETMWNMVSSHKTTWYGVKDFPGEYKIAKTAVTAAKIAPMVAIHWSLLRANKDQHATLKYLVSIGNGDAPEYFTECRYCSDEVSWEVLDNVTVDLSFGELKVTFSCDGLQWSEWMTAGEDACLSDEQRLAFVRVYELFLGAS
jgi:hypothetical protein